MHYTAITHFNKIRSNKDSSCFHSRFQRVKGTDEQKKNNISRMLASEMEHLTSIIDVLNLRYLNEIDSLNARLKADDFPDNNQEIIDSFYALYKKIIARHKKEQYEDIINQKLIKDILNNDQMTPITNDAMLNCLAQISETALASLATELLEKNPRHLLSSLADSRCLPLKGHINQQRLYHRLAQFGKKIEKVAQLQQEKYDYSRIIITTNDALAGLQILIDYLSKHKKTIEDILSHAINAHDIINDNPDASKCSSGLEIAWGLLDQLFKRNKESIFVTTSFHCAQKAIPHLANKATLVLDGHGGAVNCTFADKKEMLASAFVKILIDLFKKDSNGRIDHLILQSCMSGTLQKNTKTTNREIHKKSAGKTRTIVLTDNTTISEKLFEKMDNGMRSLASQIYNILFSTLRRHDVAFTFSTGLLCPDAYIGNGNRGVLKSTLYPLYTPWPENLSEESKKNCTILLDKNHRKIKKTGHLFEKNENTDNDNIAKETKALTTPCMTI